jgi:hypothetical protein
MSSLAPTRSRAAVEVVRAEGRAARLHADADGVAALGLAATLCAVAFVTKGGDAVAQNTWAQIALTMMGASLAALAVLFGKRGQAWGLGTVSLFGVLAALTLASVTWSVQPENSWLEGNRTISYLAVFAGAVAAARLWPTRSSTLVVGIAITATVVCGYALLAKVSPRALDAGDTLGRLSAPFDYWNATGAMAALGFPVCVWAGAQRNAHWLLRALAVPAVGVLTAVIVLSYSRGALLAAAAGLIVWFAIVPLRLRGAIVLLAGALGGGIATVWALSNHAITHDNVALSDRAGAGHSFGLVLAGTLLLLAAIGCAATLAMDRVRVGHELRRRFGIVLVCAAACVPVAGLIAVAVSHRGLSGELSQLTNTSGGVGNEAGRLTQASNSRPRYWKEGLVVGEHNLLAGAGALGYGTARTRYTNDWYGVGHAHSYVIETFADFGLIGLAVSLGLFAAWILAARRTVSSESGAEQAALVTLLAVVVVFGVHSAIDWTWFVPGVAIPALVCAGWLAGLGPVGQRVGVGRRRAGRPVVLAASGILALALVLSWVIWQPLRAEQDTAAGLVAASRGDANTAVGHLQAAENRDPVGVEPLWDQSAIELAAGRVGPARDALTRALSRQPENAATWTRLGEFDLNQHHPPAALTELSKALSLDRGSTTIQADVAQARRAAG